MNQDFTEKKAMFEKKIRAQAVSKKKKFRAS